MDGDLTDDDKREIVRDFDGLAGLRGALADLAESRGQWAGMPMPLEGQRLVVEPRWPEADKYALLDEQINPRKPADGEDKVTLRNIFWSWHRRQSVAIYEEGGKIQWGALGVPNHAGMLVDTMRASDAWGIEQEVNALALLATMLRHRMFKAYLLTGMFLESSPRSGVTYMFRKLRPTLALKADHKTDNMKILAALCLHPIAHYEASWAGAMCPTDDVIAHLALMRGDEHMFWRRANQHPAWRHEAGI